MNVIETFRKQGGLRLIRQYWKSGSLPTAVNQFVVLGRSRTALEILRLSATLKTKQKIEKRYRAILDEFDRNYVEEEHTSSHKIWICWFQGMENAPQLVQKCYQSLQENIYGREIVLLTNENLHDYVQFPDYIQDKIDQGIIPRTHMSDLLRLELLERYGGTWIDATVYCSSPDIPEYMLDSDLFLFQCLKPGRDGHATTISSWFMTAQSHNKIIAATRYLLYAYWKNHNDLEDYFLLHMFFQMAIERYADVWDRVVPFDNATPHVLLLRLFEPYDPKMWQYITARTPFHKLTHKFNAEKTALDNTFYQRILQ